MHVISENYLTDSKVHQVALCVQNLDLTDVEVSGVGNVDDKVHVGRGQVVCDRGADGDVRDAHGLRDGVQGDGSVVRKLKSVR